MSAGSYSYGGHYPGDTVSRVRFGFERTSDGSTTAEDISAATFLVLNQSGAVILTRATGSGISISGGEVTVESFAAPDEAGRHTFKLSVTYQTGDTKTRVVGPLTVFGGASQ